MVCVCVCCVQGSEVTVSFSPAGGVMLNGGTAVTRRVGRVYVLDRVLAPRIVHVPAPQVEPQEPQPGEVEPSLGCGVEPNPPCARRDTGSNIVDNMLRTLDGWWTDAINGLAAVRLPPPGS